MSEDIGCGAPLQAEVARLRAEIRVLRRERDELLRVNDLRCACVCQDGDVVEECGHHQKIRKERQQFRDAAEAAIVKRDALREAIEAIHYLTAEEEVLRITYRALNLTPEEMPHD